MSVRDRPRKPARGARSRLPKRRLLVVTEGEVTEPEYLRAFSREHRALVSVEVEGGQGDPSHIVKRALELRQADRAESGSLAYDEVWVAFDRDNFAHFTAAIDHAHANGLQVAASNECIELWLLLHFRENPGAQARARLAELLKAFVPGYAKQVDFDAHYKARYADAVRRARKLQEHADQDGEPHRNPTTGFFKLTESILASVK